MNEYSVKVEFYTEAENAEEAALLFQEWLISGHRTVQVRPLGTVDSVQVQT